MQNGKGDSPRNCFSKKFRDNFDSISWQKSKKLQFLFYLTSMEYSSNVFYFPSCLMKGYGVLDDHRIEKSLVLPLCHDMIKNCELGKCFKVTIEPIENKPN
jgi:hypothetical protein